MEETTIRECTTTEQFDECVQLQREAFGLPDLELSPRRHLIVSRQAGGWTLGAFAGDRMVGFVHHLAAVRGNEIFGYSHVMAVAKDYQNKGVGAHLKWAQRERALSEGRDFITWTWDPMQARNAHFNLNRLGVTVNTYVGNFYGVETSGLPGDRLFAMWRLNSHVLLRLRLVLQQRSTQSLFKLWPYHRNGRRSLSVILSAPEMSKRVYERNSSKLLLNN